MSRDKAAVTAFFLTEDKGVPVLCEPSRTRHCSCAGCPCFTMSWLYWWPTRGGDQTLLIPTSRSWDALWRRLCCLGMMEQVGSDGAAGVHILTMKYHEHHHSLAPSIIKTNSSSDSSRYNTYSHCCLAYQGTWQNCLRLLGMSTQERIFIPKHSADLANWNRSQIPVFHWKTDWVFLVKAC